MVPGDPGIREENPGSQGVKPWAPDRQGKRLSASDRSIGGIPALRAVRDADGDDGAAGAGRDGETAAADELQAPADIRQPDAGLLRRFRAAIRRGGLLFGIEAGPVVLDDDLTAIPGFAGLDRDEQNGPFPVHAVLDGVFHNGLEGEGRQPEFRVGRIVLHLQQPVIAHSLHPQVGFYMPKLFREGDRFFLGDGGVIRLEIVEEIL